jgi:broad specificity phosphatase PhoE
MMTRRIFVLRHGETQFNSARKLQGHCNSPLTPKGIAQAKSVGATLKKYLQPPHIRVYASSLGRAVQTAHIVCDQIGYPQSAVVEDARLKEYSLGDWEQRTIDSLLAECPDLLTARDWYLQAPRAETYDAVKARLTSWLAELPESGDIVVVSHGLTGITLRGLLMNLSYSEVWQQTIPQDAFFMVEHGTISRIDCKLAEFEVSPAF